MLAERNYGTSAGGKRPAAAFRESLMNSIIYLVGLIVIVMAILSFVGLG